MARIRWGFLLHLAACTLLSPALAASEKGRLRRITYVLQPGRAGSSGSRHQRPTLFAGEQQQQPQQQQRTFNVQLNTRYSGGGTLERTRRMSKPGGAGVQLRLSPAGQVHPNSAAHAASFAKPARFGPRPKPPPGPHGNSSAGLPLRQKHQLPPLPGVNVCGGQCCHGWSKATGSQRCIKPNCAPPCQNGGMCLRPQLCVCKPGTKGNSCEDTVMQDTSSTGGRSSVVPPWPIPQQAAQQTFSQKVQVPPKVGPMTQMAFTIKQKPPVGLPQQMQPQLLKEMGWQEDSENDETCAPLTEDEMREFRIISEQLQKNGLRKNGILKNGLICDFKFSAWKNSTFKPALENEDSDTSSSDTSDDDDV